MNKETFPTCIGFIMDGNRRWAKAHRLAPLDGHKKGYEVFLETIRLLKDMSIAHGVFYAFSTENWNRPEDEVSYLMKLFKSGLIKMLSRVGEESVRVRVVGERQRFTQEIQKLICDLEEKSAHYRDTTIWVLLSYGGRAEIVDAVNRAVSTGGAMTESSFSTLLWTADMPDPDLIIRTSGEERLSNFLPWQSVYSELMFTKTLWPDFGKEEFQRMLLAYGERKRRRGV
jgi:undecaprenyl diphosphate synthase